jgi:hypothetical protein
MTHDHVSKEIFHLAGNVPDPEGTGALGIAPTHDLTKAAIGHPMVLYRMAGKELFLEVDIHVDFSVEPHALYAHVICPLCLVGGRQVGLRIHSGAKAMHYERQAIPRPFPGWSKRQMDEAFRERGGAGGVLSIAPFQCTWEEAPELRRGDGFSTCRWQVAIDNNVARDM